MKIQNTTENDIAVNTHIELLDVSHSLIDCNAVYQRQSFLTPSIQEFPFVH